MKKKLTVIFIAVAVCTVSIVLLVLVFTDGFKRNIITGTVYSEDNVFDEIWNLSIDQKYGENTVLINGTKDAYVDYDLGVFQNIVIPESEVSIFFYDNKLSFLFYGDEYEELYGSRNIHYMYDCENNTLYGESTEAFIFGKLIYRYYQWAGCNSSFNPNDMGDYTYIYVEKLGYDL